MRWLALALITTLVSTSVLAAPKGKKRKRAKKAATSMDTGKDPAYSEKSDEGPYAPKEPPEKPAEERVVKRPERKQYRLRPRDKAVVFGEIFYGAGRGPRPGPASDGETSDAKLLSVTVGGTYDLAPAFTLGLRVPWSTASLEEPDLVTTKSTMAFGNPEIFGEYRVRLGRPTEVPILFGVAVPVAQGNYDPGDTIDDQGQRQATVNRLADAAQGLRDGELYALKRVPLVLGAGIRHERGPFEVHAWTKLSLGVNIGGDLVPQMASAAGELVVNALSLRDVTLAGVTYQFLDDPGLWAGLDGWVAYEAIEPLEYESDAVDFSPFQFVVEPRLGFIFGKLRPSVGGVLPIGGRLADGGLVGARLHVDYAF